MELGLEEQLKDLEDQTSAEDEGKKNYCDVRKLSPILLHLVCHVLIQPLLIGLFCGPLGLTTCAVSGLPIFFSCALAKRMFAWRCCGVCACTNKNVSHVLLNSAKLSRCGGA